MLSVTESCSAIFKTLVEGIEDHGGDVGTIRRFFQNGHNRELVMQVVKLLVGNIWQLADNERPLDIDFENSLNDFLETHNLSRSNKSTCEIRKSIFDWKWKETTSGSFVYRLIQFSSKKYTMAEIDTALQQFFEHPYEHAGLRELITYTATLKGEDLCDCVILAGGSTANESGNMIPHAYGTVRNDFVSISAFDTGGPQNPCFGPKYFWLVRRPVDA